MTNLLTSWNVFDIITNFLSSWQTFDVMMFLTSWRTFQRLFDVLFWRLNVFAIIDVMTNVLTPWNFITTWHTFWRPGALFDVMTIFLTSWFLFYFMTNLLSSWRIFVINYFWCYDEIVDVMTLWLHDKLFKSRHIFDFMTNFLHHDIFVTVWQTFDVMTKLLTPWRVFYVMTNLVTS